MKTTSVLKAPKALKKVSTAILKKPVIDEETKFDFNDVLFRPQKSKLKSRSEVTLDRTFKFLHSTRSWSGVPIMSSNMDTTGTFEMANSLAKHKCLTAIHKYYSYEDWKQFGAKKPEALPFLAISAGTSQRDFELVRSIT